MLTKNYRILLYSFLLVIFGIYGFMVGKYQWPPYPLLRTLNQDFFQVNTTKVNLKKEAQERNINFVETTLLPLSYTEHEFGSANSDSSTSSGAIAVYNNKIFILNKHREIYISDIEMQEASFFKIMHLHDNNDSFYKKYGKDLRIHDLLVKKSFDNYYLIISHEKYHPSINKHSLNVSSILLNNDLNFIDHTWNTVFEGSLISYPDYAYSSGGGQLADLDENRFILATGDYNLDGWMNEVELVPPSQDMDLTTGKVISINYQDGKKEILSKGHRNPQGISVTSSGKILQAEHGPNGGDEINLIDHKAFKNFGWPYQSLGINYKNFNSPVEGIPGSHSLYSPPLFSFLPSIGISDLIELENFHERWDKDILVASLKARSLYRLRISEDKVLYSEPIWVGERVRDVKQLNDKVILWLDNQNLRIYSVASNLLNSIGRHANQTELNTVLSTCLKCHHFGPTNPNHAAPTLTGLYDRNIGSDPNYMFYSNALKDKQNRWTNEKLKNYIVNPQSVYQGSSMPSSTILFSEKELNEIVELIGTYSNSIID